jgi:uncharacterized membrane protein
LKNFRISWKASKKSVKKAKKLFWKAKIAGRVKEREAEITNQVPDQRIAWDSMDGSPNSGTITFDKIDANLTRVNASIGYEPEGFLEKKRVAGEVRALL